jgi:hypothetical protein
MSESAADRIVIDDEVLARQAQTLRGVASRIGGLTGAASASLGGTSFGALNAYLVSPINHWAGRSAECVRTAGEFSTRMADGVTAARKIFAEFEEQTVALLKQIDGAA